MLFADNIPDALKIGTLWCPSGKNGDKTPYKPDGSQGVDYDHPENSFTTFEEAVRLSQRGGYDGVAMLVTDGVAIIDLDHVSKDGMMTVEAQRIVSQMDSYAEQSQGGDGVHIVVKVPKGFNFDRSKYHKNHAGKECYVGPWPKVITITGNRWNDLDVEMRPMQLLQFLKEYMTKQPAPDPTPAANMIPMDDADIIERLRRPGTRSGRLWAGDMRDYDDDPSRADYGLISAILFYTDDADQVERIFRQSGLVRPKDDRRQNGSTYLRCTIENARVSYRGGRYDPDYRSAPIDYNDAGWLDHPTTEERGGDDVKEKSAEEVTSEAAAPVTPEATGKAEEAAKKRHSLRPDDFSDCGNADVFAREYGDVLRYCDALGWLHWTGKVWERSDHAAVKLAMELAERMLKEAKAVHQMASLNVADAAAGMIIDGSAESEAQQARIEKYQDAVEMAKDFLKHARSLRSLTRIKAMLELSIPSLVIDVNELDPDPYDLNTPAGIVNLRSGQIRPHDPKAYCTRITAVAPSDDGAVMWHDFLETITVNDSSLEGFLQLVAGAAADGIVKSEHALFFVGNGSNGKSTWTNTLLAVLGDYGGTIDAEVLLNTSRNKGPMMATLRGKRLVIASELSEGRLLDSAALKTLTSTDMITGEEKFKSPMNFKPSHTLILCTNNLPHVRTGDFGTWRRLICTPFDATISTENAVENFSDVLVEKCGGYVLTWMIQGAVNYCANNFKLDPIPERVEEMTSTYKQNEDWCKRFIDDCIEPENGTDTPAREVYSVYVEWSKSIGERPKRERDFAAQMKAAGYTSVHVHSGNVYRDLTVTRDSIPEKYVENW